MYSPFPTKNKPDINEALNAAISASERERNIALVDWYVCHYYLQGVRHFTVWDWEEGDVQIAYEGYQDELNFRWEKVLNAYITELGRYMKMDVTPEAVANGYGLDSVRKAGMANAELKYMTSGMDMEQRKSRFFQFFLKYGTVGQQHSRGPGGNIRDRTNWEVVGPWELMSYPAEVHGLDDVQAIMRQRYVPLNWLRMFKHIKLGSDADMKVEWHEFGYAPNQYGILDTDGMETFSSTGDFYEDSGFVTASESKSQQSKRKEGARQWVRLTEAYALTDNQEFVYQYVVKVGDHIALNEVYDNQRVPQSLRIARHTNTGRFYGRSWLGPQLGLNDQVEKMLSRQFQLISDMDEYGMLVIPTTAGLNQNEVKKRQRRKVLFAQPDPTAPNYQPYTIQPNSSGDYPGKMANMAIQLQDTASGQSELLRGQVPGRIDSAAGAGFLFETGNISLIAPSHEVSDCFAGIYRSMLESARSELQEELAANPQASMQLPFIDDRMLGVVLDAQTGALKLDNNPLPHSWEVKVDVRDRLPTSKQQMVAEAKEHLGMGLMTPTEYEILNYRENLGLPIVSRARWEAYRKAIYTKILLFGDGQQPNPVPINFQGDNPEVSLLVITQTMASLEFMFASDRVRSAFEQWKSEIELTLGGGYPNQMPYPEDAAQMQMQAQPPGLPRPGGA